VLEAAIKSHENFAIISFIALIVLGVVSIVGITLTMIKSPLTRVAAYFIFGVSVISFLLVARTGYLGGQIRHTELTSAGATEIENSNNELAD
jgi:uncharacterized membrane protein